MSQSVAVQEEKANFTIAITLTELITALQGTDRAIGYILIDTIDIPPGFTIEYYIPVTDLETASGKVERIIVPFELVGNPDPDYALAMQFYLDTKKLVDDQSMAAALYNEPINLLRDYAMSVYAKHYIKAIFTNNDNTTTATISFRFAFGVMAEEDYKRIIYHYAERIRDWLLEKEPRW